MGQARGEPAASGAAQTRRDERDLDPGFASCGHGGALPQAGAAIVTPAGTPDRARTPRITWTTHKMRPIG